MTAKFNLNLDPLYGSTIIKFDSHLLVKLAIEKALKKKKSTVLLLYS